MLFALWIILSGVFEPIILVFGVFSSLAVVFVSRRMDVVDNEGQPVGQLRLTSLPGFLLWLLRQVVRASLEVTRRILDPRLPISPVVVSFRPSQRDEVSRAILANSITLTPGTISIDVQEDSITVHALTAEAAELLLKGEMDRRVARLERNN